MMHVRARVFAAALLLALPVYATWLAPTAAAESRTIGGELVILNGSTNRFRLVGHEGTFAAPSGMSLYEFDGKPVRVELSNGRVVQITEAPVAIDPVVHSRETITGHMVVGDAVNRTFTLSGDPRVYVAPATMDIRPYNGRRVELRLDEQGQVETIEPLALAPANVPPPANCSYDGKEFSDGAAVCQTGTQYRCEQGMWQSLGLTCAAVDVTAARSTRSCALGGATLTNGSYICRNGNTMRCDDGTWVNVGKACS